MGSNNRNTYGLKSGANKLEEVNQSYALMQKAILDVALLNASVGAPLTAAQVKAIYESNPDTNAYTDAEKAKLSALEDAKFKGVFASLSSLQSSYPIGEDGWYALIDDGSVSVTYAWDGLWVQVSTNSNLTAAQVKELYESNADTNAFTNAEQTKLAGIEAGSTSDQSNIEIKTAYEANSDTNAFTDADEAKLDSLDPDATGDMSDSEIKAAYENNADTNAYTDSEAILVATIPDLTTEVAVNSAAVTNIQSHRELLGEPTGYDLRIGNEQMKGIMEFCVDASSGEYWSISELDISTKHTGATHFGDGTILGDRTFIHYPHGSQTHYSFYHNGTEFQKTFSTITVPNTGDKHIIVYNESGVIEIATVVYEAIVIDVVTSVITINPSNTVKVIFANERHGVQMDGMTHMMLHSTQGATWASGLLVEGLVNNGDTFSNVTAGVFYDEDITHTISAHTLAPFMWREGAGGDWMVSTNHDNKLGYFNGTAAVKYNLNTAGTWTLESIGVDYIIVHFYASNDDEYPIVKVVGQNLYPDRGAARDAILSEIMDLAEGSLPTPEFLPLGCMIVHVEAVGQIEKGADDEIWIDYRQRFGVPRF